ncbi:hypothetical protein [Komarekiella delphini-convector]|nr:hypothetical protein [Komarekiella delphini-convector]
MFCSIARWEMVAVVVSIELHLRFSTKISRNLLELEKAIASALT